MDWDTVGGLVLTGIEKMKEKSEELEEKIEKNDRRFSRMSDESLIKYIKKGSGDMTAKLCARKEARDRGLIN